VDTSIPGLPPDAAVHKRTYFLTGAYILKLPPSSIVTGCKACQRLNEWRTTFATVATEQVRDFLSSAEFRGRDARAAYVAKVMDPATYCYLFATIKEREPPLSPVNNLQVESEVLVLTTNIDPLGHIPIKSCDSDIRESYPRDS